MLAPMPIQDEIKKARKEANLTQSELAELCQKLGEPIYQKDISAYESGNQTPGLKKLDVIAKVLKKKWRLLDE